MHRFFVPPQSLAGEMVAFPPETARQISRVLRLGVGAQVQALDGLGMQYTLELLSVQPTEVTGRVLRAEHADGEPQTRLHLLVALTQREKFELILQKCTEVGAAAFTPLLTSRSLVQKPAEVMEKYPRWHKILQEAAEQSHRGIVPLLHPVTEFKAALGLEPGMRGIFLWEGEQHTSLRSTLAARTPGELRLLVGPEGGFSEAEAVLAQQAGYASASLGKRILRMETAAIVAAGIVLYELG
jgi:16S rRNA (uracil1498-N3)-methyltransferase